MGVFIFIRSARDPVGLFGGSESAPSDEIRTSTAAADTSSPPSESLATSPAATYAPLRRATSAHPIAGSRTPEESEGQMPRTRGGKAAAAAGAVRLYELYPGLKAEGGKLST